MLNRGVAFLRWLLLPEKLEPLSPENVVPTPSLPVRLLSPDPLPEDPVTENKPGRFLFSWIFEQERLEVQGPEMQSSGRGFWHELFRSETLPFDPEPERQGPSLLKWILKTDRLDRS